MMARKLLPWLLGTGLLCLSAAGWWGYQVLNSAPAPDVAGFYLSKARPLPEFQLTHHSLRPYQLSDLRGHWTLVYFGYTFCPDACPMALTTLTAVNKQLEAQQQAQGVNYLFVSVDPKRDTPQRLQEYIGFFNRQFNAATGTPSELEKLARFLGVVYLFPEGQQGERYLVDHSSTILLINPNAELQAVFTPPQDPQRMVQDLNAIRHYQQP